MRRSFGFTLIEIVVAIGIIALMSVILTRVIISTLVINTKTEVTKEVKQNGDFVLNNISRLLLNARRIASSCESVGSYSSSIDIINPDGGQTAIECRLDSDVLRIASTSAGVPSYLSSPSVTLVGATCDTALTFVCVTSSDGAQSVKVNFSLAQKGQSPKTYEQASSAFGTTITLRN